MTLWTGGSSAQRNPLSASASIVGGIGDAVLLYVLLRTGVAAGTASMLSLAMAAVAMYVATLAASRSHVGTTPGITHRHAGRFALAVALAVFLRAGVLAWMERIPGCPLLATAAVAAIAAGILIRAAMAVGSGWAGEDDDRILSWRHPITALLLYAVVLHLVYLGLPELIHEEGYYWNYSRHLALGYLDHPFMVAWLIRGSTSLLGHSELGVRAGAFLCWLVGALYVFRLTRRIFNTATAVCALLLFAVLPAYWAYEFVMMPDALLIACWAAALYYLYRALIDEEQAAWLGAGLAIGAGMSSKYTMVLLGGAVVLFVIFDSRARRWLRRASPYAAAGIALLLFMPVILWNYQHEWISFVFQGTRRLHRHYAFEVPQFLGEVAVLLSPVGMAAAAVAVFSRRQLGPRTDTERGDFTRGFHLLMTSTLVPLAVFFTFSLFRNTKEDWTAPLWLGVLPYLARMMIAPWPRNAGRWRAWLSPRTWRTTAVVLLLLEAFAFHYLVLGIAGLPYPENRLGLGWPQLAVQIQDVVDEVALESGRQPLVVGMDVDRLSSWLAFYRSRAIAQHTGKNTGAGALDTGGQHLLGRDSHMYRLWFPPEQLESDRPLILVAKRRDDLIDLSPVQQARERWAGPIEEVFAEKNGQRTWHLYYRILSRSPPAKTLRSTKRSAKTRT